MWFVGEDWAEGHHDVEVQDGSGRRLAWARLPEGVAGLARLHELIAGGGGIDAESEQVLLGIETDRGPWVAALVAAGYRVFAIKPRQVARYRSGTGRPAPRATPVTRTSWPTWSALTVTSCGRWLGTAHWWRGSKSPRGRIRT